MYTSDFRRPLAHRLKLSDSQYETIYAGYLFSGQHTFFPSPPGCRQLLSSRSRCQHGTEYTSRTDDSVTPEHERTCHASQTVSQEYPSSKPMGSHARPAGRESGYPIISTSTGRQGNQSQWGLGPLVCPLRVEISRRLAGALKIWLESELGRDTGHPRAAICNPRCHGGVLHV